MKIKYYICSFFLLFITTFWAQNNEKLALPFRYLLEQQANNNKTNAIPSLFAKTVSSRLNKTTGKIDQGYNCIIYTQSAEVLKPNGIPVQSIQPTFATAWLNLDQITKAATLPEVSYIDVTKTLKPSKRGELEITDIINIYLNNNTIDVIKFSRGTAWLDAGQPDTLFQSAAYVKTIQERQGIRIGCIEEECYKKKFINKQQLTNIVEKIPKSEYKQYLEKLL